MTLKFTKTSRKAELEGVWLNFDDGREEGNVLELLIARSTGNPHYDAELAKLMRPYQKKIEQKKDISNKVAKDILKKVIAKEILLGWNEEKLTDEEGKPVKYSFENAMLLLHGDNDLFDFVTDESVKKSNFLTKKK